MGVRVLSGATTLALWALVVFTAMVVVLCGVVISGRGTVTVSTILEGPYSIGFEDKRSRSITVGEDRAIAAYANFEPGEESRYLDAPPRVVAPVLIDRDDTDSRAVGIVGVLTLLALAWVALLSSRRIIHSARDGDPFDASNVMRFRRVAAAVVCARLVLTVGERTLTTTLDVDLPVEVSLTSVGWLPVIGVTLVLLALAEIFRVGSNLRAFERATI